MTVIGFLVNRDNVSNSYLSNCLNSLARTVDSIVIYDDASTEDVRPLYLSVDATVIYGRHPAFQRELFSKQALLKVALQQQPDFLIWIDGDAVLGRHFESRERTEKILTNMVAQQIDLLHLHNLNLFRSNFWYRVDQKFNDLDHGVIWKNSGEMHYRPIARLHQKQYPQFYRDVDRPIVASKFEQPDGQLLHFGFASEIEIARKYFTYRAHGQTGWALDRLVDESTLDLKPARKDWFPEWLLPALGEPGGAPVPFFTPESMRTFSGFDEWLDDYHGRRSDMQVEGALQL